MNPSKIDNSKVWHQWSLVQRPSTLDIGTGAQPHPPSPRNREESQRKHENSTDSSQIWESMSVCVVDLVRIRMKILKRLRYRNVMICRALKLRLRAHNFRWKMTSLDTSTVQQEMLLSQRPRAFLIDLVSILSSATDYQDWQCDSQEHKRYPTRVQNRSETYLRRTWRESRDISSEPVRK
jgi:hypothetical protein